MVVAPRAQRISNHNSQKLKTLSYNQLLKNSESHLWMGLTSIIPPNNDLREALKKTIALFVELVFQWANTNCPYKPCIKCTRACHLNQLEQHPHTYCHNQWWEGILILIYQLDKGKYKTSYNTSAKQRHIDFEKTN